MGATHEYTLSRIMSMDRCLHISLIYAIMDVDIHSCNKSEQIEMGCQMIIYEYVINGHV